MGSGSPSPRIRGGTSISGFNALAARQCGSRTPLRTIRSRRGRRSARRSCFTPSVTEGDCSSCLQPADPRARGPHSERIQRGGPMAARSCFLLPSSRGRGGISTPSPPTATTCRGKFCRISCEMASGSGWRPIRMGGSPSSAPIGARIGASSPSARMGRIRSPCARPTPCCRRWVGRILTGCASSGIAPAPPSTWKSRRTTSGTCGRSGLHRSRSNGCQRSGSPR